MSRYIKWGMERDKTILDSAVELTNAQARHHYLSYLKEINLQGLEHLVKKRIKLFLKAPVVMNEDYHGTVLEIGGGLGVLSACFSKMQGVEQVLALEYSTYNVEKLMPIVFQKLKADEKKITRVHGSFNDLKLNDNSVDFIVSTGTLHHSEDLGKTARECYRVLKPGGWCIHADGAVKGGIKVTKQAKLKVPRSREYILSRYGESYADKMINAEMVSSHVLQLCDIEYNFSSAGFDIHSFPMIRTRIKMVNTLLSLLYRYCGDLILSGAVDSLINIPHIPVYPWFAHEGLLKVSSYKSLLFVCRKPPFPYERRNNEITGKRSLNTLIQFLFKSNRKLRNKYNNDLKAVLKGV